MKKIVLILMYLIANQVIGQSYVVFDNSSSILNSPSGLSFNRTNSTGLQNVAIGSGVLANNTSGENNTGLGSQALNQNLTGLRNTAVGTESMQKYKGKESAPLGTFRYAGNDNTAIGYRALAGGLYAGFGNDNVAIGNYALEKLSGFTLYTTIVPHYQGLRNIAIGVNSQNSNTRGADNISIGYNSLFSLNDGYDTNLSIYWAQRNIAIGQNSLYSNVKGVGNIAIGNDAAYNELGNSKLYIENSNSSSPLIGGDFTSNKVGINRLMTDLSTASQNFQVQGDALITGVLTVNSTTYTSDARFKKNILPLQNSLANILKINGVSYDWRKDEFKDRDFTDKKQIGLIAQEVEKIFPAMVETDANGYKSINYIQFTPILIEALKDLTHKVQNLESQNEKLLLLTKRIENLEKTTDIRNNTEKK